MRSNRTSERVKILSNKKLKNVKIGCISLTAEKALIEVSKEEKGTGLFLSGFVESEHRFQGLFEVYSEIDSDGNKVKRKAAGIELHGCLTPMIDDIDYMYLGWDRNIKQTMLRIRMNSGAYFSFPQCSGWHIKHYAVVAASES